MVVGLGGGEGGGLFLVVFHVFYVLVVFAVFAVLTEFLLLLDLILIHLLVNRTLTHSLLQFLLYLKIRRPNDLPDRLDLIQTTLQILHPLVIRPRQQPHVRSPIRAIANQVQELMREHPPLDIEGVPPDPRLQEPYRDGPVDTPQNLDYFGRSQGDPLAPVFVLF